MITKCERFGVPHIFQWYFTCHSFGQADLWKKQGKWGKENPSLELTSLQPMLSTQFTLGRNAWGNSTSLQASTGPTKPEHTDFPLQDPLKIWTFNSSSLFSPLFPHRPCPSLLYKRDDYSSLIFFTTTFQYRAKLLNSEGGPLSHPRKGEKTLIVGTFCILLKHLILQKYVISNQPILIVHLECNQLFYCKITLSDK